MNTFTGKAERSPSQRGDQPRRKSRRGSVVVAIALFVVAAFVLGWQLRPVVAWLGIPLGTYEKAPDPCGLVSDEAAARLVPGFSRHPDPGRPRDRALSVAGCSWGTPGGGTSSSGGIGELVLQVSVFHTGDRYAEDAFVRDRKKVPASDLDHLGDQAYVTTSLRPVLEPDDESADQPDRGRSARRQPRAARRVRPYPLGQNRSGWSGGRPADSGRDQSSYDRTGARGARPDPCGGELTWTGCRAPPSRSRSSTAWA